MNKEIINNFIQYYVSIFNNKSKFQDFLNVWNDHSSFTYNDHLYKGRELITILTELYAYSIDNHYVNASFMIIGDRRANILLSYTIVDSTNNKKIISQYIQLAYSNQKTYWIHSSLLNMN
jgi:hypothetical protein